MASNKDTNRCRRVRFAKAWSPQESVLSGYFYARYSAADKPIKTLKSL